MKYFDADIEQAIERGEISHRLAIYKQFNRTTFDQDIANKVSGGWWDKEVALQVQAERGATHN